MPVFCTQLSVFLSSATAAELLQYFFGDGLDDVARAALTWLAEHRRDTHGQVLALMGDAVPA